MNTYISAIQTIFFGIVSIAQSVEVTDSAVLGGVAEGREFESESESELFTGDTSKDNHSPGPVFREVSP